MDIDTKIEIIQVLCEKLRACYIFPEVVERICAYLQECLQTGEYDDLVDGNLFALALTLHLQEVNGDEHLWVKWHTQALPEDDGQLRLNQDWQAERRLEARLENYGFYKLERLPGNVGYLDIRYLHRPEWGGEAVANSMGFLAHTQALIIDVRQCLGGYPGMVALVCSYLFGEHPIHLASIYWRDEDITQEYWTEASLPVPRYPEKAVYVLTSQATFSAGEMLTDILQSHKRGTIIGEKTDGGAHAGASYRIHPHFEAFIPIGLSINPLTGTNWEGCGVTPDISVPGEASFNTAYKLALQSVLFDLGEPGSDPLRKLADEAREALKRLN
jgi:C-terminal processing protease CtpA/Prc